MSNETCDIAIVGAGAAGLAAAIFAGERLAGQARRIVLLDGAKKIGAKILVSGGGRCNVTHYRVGEEDFNGGPRHLIRHVLKAFDEHAAARWFESMGVALKREATGKLFPVSDRAQTVLTALLDRCANVGVEVWPDRRVHEIERVEASGEGEPSYKIMGDDVTLVAKRVILATGGRSLPRTGSDGFGYKLARSLGHTVSPTSPALAPLVLDQPMFHADVSGVALPATLSTFVNNKRIDRRTASLLWTHFGISGPAAMDASRHWTLARQIGQLPVMRCALLTDMDFAAAEQWLMKQLNTQTAKARSGVARVLSAKLPAALAEAVMTHMGIDPSTPGPQLKKADRKQLIRALTELELPIAHHRGWNYAEATAGGVPLSEIDYRTMQSRCAPGLYLAGEILDVDGRIGGFNFQWAWSTGFIAGMAAAQAAA